MTTDDLLFQSLDGLPEDQKITRRWEIRAEILKRHGQATNAADREALLSDYKKVTDELEQGMASRETPLAILEHFRDIRRKDYNQLLINEVLIGEHSGIINAQRMATITTREVAAGRMAADDEFHKLAVASAYIIANRPKPYDLSFLTRWFRRRKK